MSTSGELRMPLETQVALHHDRIAGQAKWAEKHEREDDERHRKEDDRHEELAAKVNGIDRLNETLAPIIQAYWGDGSSKVSKSPVPPPRVQRISSDVRQGGMVGGLVTVIWVLLEVVKAQIHHDPPPPPSAAQVAAEVRTMLQATPKP